MADTQLAFASATEIRSRIASKEVSTVELVELFCDRIEALDSSLNSYLTVDREGALRSARAADRAVMDGEDLGPLHGVPISVKDLEMTRGLRTTGGSLVFEDRVPEADSIVVERVRKSGAVILGKTNTPEFGLLGHTMNRLGDHCRNPWNTDLTAGGSSGGAGAALAGGLCTLATGSDGGGSIRIPASFCGIYGIKPTQGRVPRYAGTPGPVVANQTSQSGPMTRTVRDSAALLQVLAGHDSRDPASLRGRPDDYLAAADRGVAGMRLGWSPDFGYAAMEPEVFDVSEHAALAFQEMGCSVEQVDLSLDHPYDTFMTVFGANASVSYGGLLSKRDDLADYTVDFLERGSAVTGAEYGAALGRLDVARAKFDDVFEQYDLLLSPTMPVTAFPVGAPPHRIAGREIDPFWGYVQFTAIINAIGFTAATVPCGFSSDGLPVGLHVIGRHGDEASVIAASAAFEEARPWADKRPPVS